MKHHLARPAHCLTIAALLLSMNVTLVAEPRTFKNAAGKEIVAEPVSNLGDGTVELKRGDGNLFKVKITDLSTPDQEFLRKWAEANPPKVNYRFEIEATAEKVSGVRSTSLGGYKDVKNELWTYRVKVTNLSRETVGKLKAEYRVFMINAADGEFRNSDGISEGYISGAAPLETDLRFNESTTFTTGEVKIDRVTYDWSSLRDERYKDALRGIMVRIKDSAGKVVEEFISSNNSMTGKTWDTVPASMEIKKDD